MKEQMSIQATEENLEAQADSWDRDNVIVTPDEARERGYAYKMQPPEPRTCRFCGRTVQAQGIVLGGVVYYWRQNSRCTCDQAKAYWQEYDRKQAEEAAQKKDADRNRAMQDKIDRLIGKSGIKKRFQQRTFPNFKTDTPGRRYSYRIAKEYADNFAYHRSRGDGLYIEGTNGTGKTHLAAAIALQLIGEGIPVICKTSSDMLMDIKRAFESKEIKESEIFDIYKKVELLIIDDLGKEQCSDWSMSTLYSILNDRYEDMRPTIVTTNYNVDELIEALTPRGSDDTKIVAIISRLRETSTVITMAWADARSEA